LYGGGSCWCTLRAEHRLRVFENTLQRRIFGPKRGEVTGEWRRCYLGDSNQEKQGVWLVWEVGAVHTRFWWGDQRVRDHLEDRGIDGRILLK